MIVINAIIETIRDFTIIIIITLILNYLFNKDFKKLINKIKKIAFSRQTKKATLIQKTLYNYFFTNN